MDGISAGSLGGAAKIEVHGPQNALAIKLSANTPDLSGSRAQVNAVATLDVPGRTISLASLQADWNQQTVRLLAPATLSFANGAAIDRLRLGLRQAVLEVNGRVTPTLDLTASLRNLPADIAAIVAPSAAADGTIAADARLTGSLARPDRQDPPDRDRPAPAHRPRPRAARRQRDRRRHPERRQRCARRSAPPRAPRT